MNAEWTRSVPIAADFERDTPVTAVPIDIPSRTRDETPHLPSNANAAGPGPQAGQLLGGRIDLLESARGFLACWVMIGHAMMFLGFMRTLPSGTPTWLHRILLLIFGADVPVQVFMILSGFVICLLIDTKREPYRVYIVRRFLRLFPAFAVCFVAGILINPLQQALVNLPWGRTQWVAYEAHLAHLHWEYLVENIAAHATMLFGLIPVQIIPDATGAFLGPGWSISTEWQFYLLAPLLFTASRRLTGLAAIALGVVILPKLLPLAAFENASTSLILFHTQYFFIGAVSYTIWKFVRSSRAAGLGPTQGIALAGLTVAFFMPNAALAFWTVLFSSICQLAACPDGVEARVIGAVGHSRIATFLGRISYSIYLSHWPVAILLVSVTQPLYFLRWPQFAAAFVALVCLTTVAVSVVLHRTVEMPAIRWGSRLFRTRPPRMDPALSPTLDVNSSASAKPRTA